VRHRTDLLTIGETAERSGVAPSALRYYESQGLISSTRTTGNQRRYQRSTCVGSRSSGRPSGWA